MKGGGTVEGLGQNIDGQKEKDEGRQSGKVRDREKDGTTLSRSHPRAFFPHQNDQKLAALPSLPGGLKQP